MIAELIVLFSTIGGDGEVRSVMRVGWADAFCAFTEKQPQVLLGACVTEGHENGREGESGDSPYSRSGQAVTKQPYRLMVLHLEQAG